MAQYYAVWIGKKPGIYDNWNDCKEQVDKFPGSKFRKLKSTEYNAAIMEFNNEKGEGLHKISVDSVTSNSSNTVVVNKPKEIKVDSFQEKVLENLNKSESFNNQKPLEGVLTVDGASNGENCEFQAVWYPSGEHVSRSKKYEGGTNNIAEFLGIVFALKYLMKNNLPLKVYSDSVTAMAWYRNKKANSTANETGKATDELNTLIAESEGFLRKNAHILKSAEVMKWHTGKWGEIPADFGRKGNSKKPRL